MPQRVPGLDNILRFIGVWISFFVLGALAWVAFGPRGPLGYTPAPIRFVACGSIAAVGGLQALVALASAVVVVLLAESFSAGALSLKTRVDALVLVSTVPFVLSFGGALVFRRHFIDGCA